MNNAETIKYLRAQAKKHGLTFKQVPYVKFEIGGGKLVPAYQYVPRGSDVTIQGTSMRLVDALNNWESGGVIERHEAGKRI